MQCSFGNKYASFCFSHPVVQKLAIEHDENAMMLLRVPFKFLFPNMKKNGVFDKGPVLYVTVLTHVTALPLCHL